MRGLRVGVSVLMVATRWLADDGDDGDGDVERGEEGRGRGWFLNAQFICYCYCSVEYWVQGYKCQGAGLAAGGVSE